MKIYFKGIFIIFVSLFLVSCQPKSIVAIENQLGCSLKGVANLDKEFHKWNDFNGDGYQIEIYSIRGDRIQTLVQAARGKGFCIYKKHDASNAILIAYNEVDEWAGYYSYRECNDSIEMLYIDTLCANYYIVM